jgi:subtilase family serine protease
VVTIAPPAEKPDLVITGINKTETDSGYIISYTIKNQGTANAGTSTTKLYANGTYKTSDNVPSVAAGASVSRYFGSWKYNK